MAFFYAKIEKIYVFRLNLNIFFKEKNENSKLSVKNTINTFHILVHSFQIKDRKADFV